MRLLIYSSPGAFTAFQTDRARVEGVIRRIANGTSTRGLVVTVHLAADGSGWNGGFYAKDIPRKLLLDMRGPWRTAHASGIPPGLPEKFPMIEIYMGAKGARYPSVDYNLNGFRMWCRSFHAHLGYIFAHELHHYRRYKLGLHRGEGEKSADKWAAGRVCEVGYHMTMKPYRLHLNGKKPPRRKKVPRRTKMSAAYWKRIVSLKRWSVVRLAKSDNRRVPPGTLLRFLRPMRNSYRALVLDHRGDERVVPIEWLRIVEER